MKIVDSIINNIERLAEAGCDAPRTDVIATLEFILGKDRAWILAHDDYALKKAELTEINRLIDRRIKREPLAYVLGKKEFYGREFIVTPNVLIPRPESENIIEIAKNLKTKKFIDIGTGSGCLAITIKLENPEAVVIAIDISNKTLEVAKQNAKKYSADIEFLEGDLLEPLRNTKYKIQSSAIIANLPYVPDSLVTSPEIEAEPALALFSGEDGLDLYQKFWQKISELKQKPKYIITESLETQHMIMAGLAQKSNYTEEQKLGLIQLFNLGK